MFAGVHCWLLSSTRWIRSHHSLVLGCKQINLVTYTNYQSHKSDKIWNTLRLVIRSGSTVMNNQSMIPTKIGQVLAHSVTKYQLGVIILSYNLYLLLKPSSLHISLKLRSRCSRAFGSRTIKTHETPQSQLYRWRWCASCNSSLGWVSATIYYDWTPSNMHDMHKLYYNV